MSDDPLSLPSNTTISPRSRVRIEMLVSPATVNELRRLRNKAGARPDATASWIGALVDQLIDVAGKNPDANPRQVHALAHERPLMRTLRHTLGSQLTASDEPLSARELAIKSDVRLSPYVIGALNDLQIAGLVECKTIRLKADHGPTPRGWSLTLAGVSLTATDHPSDEVRFTLAGLLEPTVTIKGLASQHIPAGKLVMEQAGMVAPVTVLERASTGAIVIDGGDTLVSASLGGVSVRCTVCGSIHAPGEGCDGPFWCPGCGAEVTIKGQCARCRDQYELDKVTGVQA